MDTPTVDTDRGGYIPLSGPVPTLETVPKCDACGLPVIDPGRWRHTDCTPPPLPRAALDVIARVRKATA